MKYTTSQNSPRSIYSNSPVLFILMMLILGQETLDVTWAQDLDNVTS